MSKKKENTREEKIRKKRKEKKEKSLDRGKDKRKLFNTDSEKKRVP